MFKKNQYVSRTHVGEEILRTIAAVALDYPATAGRGAESRADVCLGA